MSIKTGGQRPRPRVAILGDFEDDDANQFVKMFPTIWQGNTFDDLKTLVDVRETDLLIIAPTITFASDWIYNTHVICFSSEIESLPGPILYSKVKNWGTAETEEFIFPDVPLEISRRRDADFGEIKSVRNWVRLELHVPGNKSQDKSGTANRIFKDGAIICEKSTKAPLATFFVREENGLGICWLPMVVENKAAWVEIIIDQWARSDNESFPNFSNWISSNDWMVHEEEQIIIKIKKLESEKTDTITKIEYEIGELSKEYASAQLAANNGRRRLITAQGPELVDEVEYVLKEIGFKVENIDKLIGDQGPKREDLRLTYKNKDSSSWTAIVEVRGYSRSGGMTADFQRLSRFTKLYNQEFGKYPDKIIYIVNGEIESLPNQRQMPLVSAPEDVNIFAESDGILIWTLDLFKAVKSANPAQYPVIVESIMNTKGRWLPPALKL